VRMIESTQADFTDRRPGRTGIPRAARDSLLREAPGGGTVPIQPLSGPNGSEALRPRGSRRRWGHSDPRRAGRDDRGLDRRAVFASHAADAAPPLRLVERLRKTPLAASGSALECRGGGEGGDKSGFLPSPAGARGERADSGRSPEPGEDLEPQNQRRTPSPARFAGTLSPWEREEASVL
jgi:hypothetical protein